jgi:hypothetical protein
LEKQIAREPWPIRSASSMQYDRLAALRQIDRERQPDRSGTDYYDGMSGRAGSGVVLVCTTPITELIIAVLRHALISKKLISIRVRNPNTLKVDERMLEGADPEFGMYAIEARAY